MNITFLSYNSVELHIPPTLHTRFIRFRVKIFLTRLDVRITFITPFHRNVDSNNGFNISYGGMVILLISGYHRFLRYLRQSDVITVVAVITQIKPEVFCHSKKMLKDFIVYLNVLYPRCNIRVTIYSDRNTESDPNLIWQPFETLSGGEKTKVLLALSFTQENSFPLIDEPTNHLDEASRKQISEYLKQQKMGYIVVSHDREFLNQVTNHILTLENKQIHLYQGNYASYEATKEKRDIFNINKNKKLKSEINELNKSRQKIQTFSKKSENKKNARTHLKTELNSNLDKGFLGHKAAKIMKRSKNVERRMEKDIEAKQG